MERARDSDPPRPSARMPVAHVEHSEVDGLKTAYEDQYQAWKGAVSTSLGMLGAFFGIES